VIEFAEVPARQSNVACLGHTRFVCALRDGDAEVAGSDDGDFHLQKLRDKRQKTKDKRQKTKDKRQKIKSARIDIMFN
jgi:hypothetical protein